MYYSFPHFCINFFEKKNHERIDPFLKYGGKLADLEIKPKNLRKKQIIFQNRKIKGRAALLSRVDSFVVNCNFVYKLLERIPNIVKFHNFRMGVAQQLQ